MKMKNSKTKFVGRWWVLTAVVFGVGLLNASRGYSEEAKPAPPAAAAKADAPAKAEVTDPAAKDAAKKASAEVEKPSDKAAAPPTKATESAPVSPAAPAATAAPSVEAAPRTSTAASTDEKATSKEAAMPAGKSQTSIATKAIPDLGLQDQARSGWSPWLRGLVILA